jgi:hypothetical protein
VTVPPNYLGSQSNLTGIPSLLLSGLQNVQDPIVQTALYQIQNWANSFYTWQFETVTGTYTTGGVTVVFPKPFASTVNSITLGMYPPAIAGSITTVHASGFDIQLFGAGGTQIANGLGFQFSYMAEGH